MNETARSITSKIPHLNSQQSGDGDPSDSIDILAVLRTLWRGKLWIALTGFVFFVGAVYYAYFVAEPVYSAQTTVVLDNRQEQVSGLDSVVSNLSADQATINTEVAVIRSRALIEKVVQKLDLVSDAEFNTTLREEPAISFEKIKTFIGDIVRGPRPETPPPSDEQVFNSVVTKVSSHITVSNRRGSYIFLISVDSRYRAKAVKIANTLAEVYILNQLEVKFKATEQATAWLTERVAELQFALEESETAIKSFKASSDLTSREALNALDRQIKDLRDRLANAEAALQESSKRVTALEEAARVGDIGAMRSLANDQTLERLARILEKDAEKDRTAFNARFEQVVSRTKLERQRSENQVAALRNSIAELETSINQQGSDFVKLEQMQREVEANRLIYEYFLGRLKETSVQQGIQQADSRILSPARGGKLTAPKKTQIIAISVFLGLLISSLVVILRGMVKNSYRSAEELETDTGYSVIGQIPSIPARRRKSVLKYLIEKPNSAASEAIRNLRTSLLLSNVDKPPQVIMSTSSLPGEGKTTQSIALTRNYASLGKKVLLIEGDIRRLVFSNYFDIRGKRGLLSVLSGQADPADVVVFDEQLGADILVGERSSVNAADIFTSDKFAQFIKAAREAYDVIIIDTPPVLIVPDARVIGQSVDAIVFAVKWDSTTRRQVKDALAAFESVNLRVTGLVLSQIDSKRMKSYGYGEAYYTYGKSYYHN